MIIEKQQDISELYVIRFEGKYLAKGQEIKFTPILGDAELFNNKGCAESLRGLMDKTLVKFEVINVKDLKEE